MHKRIWVKKGGTFTMVKERPLGREKDDEGKEKGERAIQDFFHENPEMIPGEDMGLWKEGGAQNLMVVGRETAISSGWPDLLAVTRGGEIVIIEFKDIGNADGRRKVIGQLLDYGAGLYKECGTYDSFEAKIAKPYFQGKTCKEQTRGADSLERAARKYFQFEESSSRMGDNEPPDRVVDEFREFKKNLEKNLHDGRFIYVVACPTMHDNAQDIIEYLRRCTNVRIHGVELEYFKTPEGTEVLYPKAVPPERPPKPPSSGNISDEDFRIGIQSAGAEYWVAVQSFSEKVAKHLRGKMRPCKSSVGAYLRFGKHEGAVMYIPCDGKTLNPVSPARLQQFVGSGYISQDASDDYWKRLNVLLARSGAQVRDLDSTSVATTPLDAKTYQAVLDMNVEWYEQKVMNKASH